MFTHHPRIYHLRPDNYPDGFSHLDSIPIYDPAAITEYEPSQAQRWHAVLCWLEGLVRADKARLAADRAAARQADPQPDWTPSQRLLRRGLPSGQP